MTFNHFSLEHFLVLRPRPADLGPPKTLMEAIGAGLLADEELAEAIPGGIHNSTATVPDAQPYLLVTDRGSGGSRGFKSEDAEVVVESINFRAVAEELADANAIIQLVYGRVNQQSFVYATGHAGPGEESRRDTGEIKGRVLNGEKAHYAEITWSMYHRTR